MTLRCPRLHRHRLGQKRLPLNRHQNNASQPAPRIVMYDFGNLLESRAFRVVASGGSMYLLEQ